jgi:hypothetical protein
MERRLIGIQSRRSYSYGKGWKAHSCSTGREPRRGRVNSRSEFGVFWERDSSARRQTSRPNRHFHSRVNQRCHQCPHRPQRGAPKKAARIKGAHDGRTRPKSAHPYVRCSGPSRASTIERQIVRPTAVVRLFGLTPVSASGKRDSPAQR